MPTLVALGMRTDILVPLGKYKVGFNTLATEEANSGFSDISSRKFKQISSSDFGLGKLTTVIKDSYTFVFEPNPDWSHFYSPAPEIHAYIKRTVYKYNLDKQVQLNSKVLSTIWSDETGKWDRTLDVNGSVKQDEADILINGSGFLK